MIGGGARRWSLSGTAALLGLVLTLAACATAQTAPPPGRPPSEAPAPERPPATVPVPAAEAPGPATLPGWNDEDHLAAFEAWADGCRVARDTASRVQCDRAMHLNQTSRPVTPSAARAFFESVVV